ncbi:MAG: DUF2878 family protein [Hyphomicrobium sp.]|nr:DUF2878 family protein [Hyphomicrobium sp.]
MTLILIDIVAYYAAWAGAAIGAAHNRPDLAAAACLAALVPHLVSSADRTRSLALMAVGLGIGLLVESVLAAAGATAFKSQDLGPWLPPLWSLLLWMSFATLLPRALVILQARPLLGAVLAALAAPLAYHAGSEIGALTVLEPYTRSLVLIALAWGIAMPILLLAARRLAHA